MKYVRGAGMVVACVLTTQLAMAQMSSTNYQVTSDDFSAAGNQSSSTNYQANDTLSEITTPSGEDLASTNYLACAGFQCTVAEEFLTVRITTDTAPCSATTPQENPLTQALGTLSTSAVSTAAEKICVIVTSTTPGGAVATIRSANAALASTSVPSRTIDTASATLVAGTEGYGVCTANTANGFTAASPFNGSCDATTNHAVGALTTSPQNILTTSGMVVNAYGEILTKAAISAVTPAASDYGDTLTIIVLPQY